MKIANKALITRLNLTENPTVISLGMRIKEDAERFTGELETVKSDLEYDYSYNVGLLKN